MEAPWILVPSVLHLESILLNADIQYCTLETRSELKLHVLLGNVHNMTTTDTLITTFIMFKTDYSCVRGKMRKCGLYEHWSTVQSNVILI